MSLSMERVIEILSDEGVNRGNLGFVLTILRDNAEDDEAYNVLDVAVQTLWENQKKSK